jgi:hypothetical protein
MPPRTQSFFSAGSELSPNANPFNRSAGILPAFLTFSASGTYAPPRRPIHLSHYLMKYPGCIMPGSRTLRPNRIRCCLPGAAPFDVRTGTGTLTTSTFAFAHNLGYVCRGAMLSKLIGGLSKRGTKRQFRSFLIVSSKRLKTPLNHRKQSVGPLSNRIKIDPPFKGRTTLPIFEGAGRGNSAKPTETSV